MEGVVPWPSVRAGGYRSLMDSSLNSVVAFISASLAPAVLLTGVGLLLAELQTKYSTLVNVLRQLTGEARHHLAEESPESRERLAVVRSQMTSLMRRAKLVSNTICSFYLTIFFLMISSLLIGLGVLAFPVPEALILMAFTVAMATLFTGVGFATLEALLSFQIVKLDVRECT